MTAMHGIIARSAKAAAIYFTMVEACPASESDEHVVPAWLIARRI